MATCMIFDEDEVFRVDPKKGLIYGLVIESSEYASSDEEGEFQSENNKSVKRGTVRVAWHPNGEEEVIAEHDVQLADRSLMPGDVVRRLIKGENSQRGYVLDTDVTCHLQILGTNKVICDVNSKETMNMQDWIADPSDVTLDSWVGKIEVVNQDVVLHFTDGARCRVDESNLYGFVDISEKREECTEFVNTYYYPGQQLSGTMGDLSNAKWINTTRLHSAWTAESKSHKKVIVKVEKNITSSVEVHWLCRGFSKGDTNSNIDPPPKKVEGEALQRMKQLECFRYCSVQIGDKYFYKIKDTDEIKFTGPLKKNKTALSYILSDRLDTGKDGAKCLKEKVDNVDTKPMKLNLSEAGLHTKECVPQFHPVCETKECLTSESLTYDNSTPKDIKPEQPNTPASMTNADTYGEVNSIEALGTNAKFTESFPTRTDSNKAISGGVESSAKLSDISKIQDNSSEVSEMLAMSSEMKEKLAKSSTASETLAKSEDDHTDDASDDSEDEDGESDSVSTASTHSSASETTHKKKKARSFTGLRFKHAVKGKKTHKGPVPMQLKTFKAGDVVPVEILYTFSKAQVVWQDGSIEADISSPDLYPIHHLDELEFFPGDCVVDSNDPNGPYGVVIKVDHHERTCLVKWLKPVAGEDPEEVGQSEVSVYDIKEHPDFKFRIGHGLVVQVGGGKDDQSAAVGQVTRLMPDGRVQVLWSDNTSSPVWPHQLYLVSDENSDESDSDNEDDDEDESSGSSWETEDEEDIVDDDIERPNEEADDALKKDVAQILYALYQKDTGSVMGSMYLAILANSLGSTDALHEEDISPAFYEPMQVLLKRYMGIGHLFGISKCAAKEMDALSKKIEEFDRRLKAMKKSQEIHKKFMKEQNLNVMDQKLHSTMQKPKNKPLTQLIRQRMGINSENTEDGAQHVDDFGAASNDALKGESENIQQAEGASANTVTGEPIEGIRNQLKELIPEVSLNLELHYKVIHNHLTTKQWNKEELGKIKMELESKFKKDTLCADSGAKILPNTGAKTVKILVDYEGITDKNEHEKVSCSVVTRDDKVTMDDDKHTSLCDKERKNGKDTIMSDSGEIKDDKDIVKEESQTTQDTAVGDLKKNPGAFCKGRFVETLSREVQTTADITKMGTPQNLFSNLENSAEESQGTDSISLQSASKGTQTIGIADCGLGEILTDSKEILNKHILTRVQCSVSGINKPGINLQETSKSDLSTEETDEENDTSTSETEDALTKGEDSSTDISVFQLIESAPDSHKFKQVNEKKVPSKTFMKAIRKEMKLLCSTLPSGIIMKGFEDRMDIFSVMIIGPKNTPYEDGLFFFDIQLPQDYNNSPPVFHYHAYCTDRLNPNLYEDGKVCVSLLGTWGGKGSEVWTSDSNLLQVFISIQGLILCAEPYYNEAGYERQKGTQQGMENSKVYNEMAIIKVMESMVNMMSSPPECFKKELYQHMKQQGHKMIARYENWLELSTKTSGENIQQTEELKSDLQGDSSCTHTANSKQSPEEQATSDIESCQIDKQQFNEPDFPLLPASKGFCISLRKHLAQFTVKLKEYLNAAI